MERRRFLKLAATTSALAGMGGPVMAVDSRAQRTFVLVHGAWHGGWCWRPLMQLLQAKGHRVTTPTLTGLGERVHLMSAGVNLDTHIADVVEHIRTEELSHVVLVGHSYGGFVIRGVTARIPQAIDHVIYLDAFVPENGEAVVDYAGERASSIRDLAAHTPAAGLPPLPPAAFGISDPAQAAWVARRMTPQPVNTYLQPLAVTTDEEAYRRSYIACLKPKLDVFDTTRARIKAAQGWHYLELAEGHDVMVTAPGLLARRLLALA
jgi:pimeloyl-ACP methyl ester carboxylesterase